MGVLRTVVPGEPHPFPIPPEHLPPWPQFDPEIMQRYGGKWIVVDGHEVIAANENPHVARQEAAVKLGVDPDTLEAVAICSPGNDTLPG
jgi:hypothetical protein